MPHFDRFVRPLPGLHPWVRRVERGFDGLGVIGLDEGTGLIIDGGRWQVHGRGAVTVIDDRGWRTAGAGAALDGSVALARQRALAAA